MVNVGARIRLSSGKGPDRDGVVTAVTGSILRVRWPSGENTMVVPAPGTLTVLASSGDKASATRKRVATERTAKKAPAKKAPAKKAPAKKAPARKAPTRKAAPERGATKHTASANKAATKKSTPGGAKKTEEVKRASR